MSVASSNIRCVCFDWGGVILRFCRSFEEGVRAAGLDLREGAIAPEAILARRGLANRYSRGELTTEQFLAEACRATSGIYSEAELERINHAWLIEEYPGVDAIVDELNTLPQLETALLSNTTAIHWERQQPHRSLAIPHFPTAARLRHRHASHLLGLLKPDDAIYAAFERETGFAGDSIVFFDDLEENVQAARARGWCAIRIDHAGDTAAQIRAALRDLRIL
ncbi:MAG: HAD-IA family hydrolase [Phycisphaeraceae bacterium]|nr:HAD-IA family hydrolase [Phycisphaeraceae bacterium]